MLPWLVEGEARARFWDRRLITGHGGKDKQNMMNKCMCLVPVVVARNEDEVSSNDSDVGDGMAMAGSAAHQQSQTRSRRRKAVLQAQSPPSLLVRLELFHVFRLAKSSLHSAEIIYYRRQV